jgi:hypothetical protein
MNAMAFVDDDDDDETGDWSESKSGLVSALGAWSCRSGVED